MNKESKKIRQIVRLCMEIEREHEMTAIRSRHLDDRTEG